MAMYSLEIPETGFGENFCTAGRSRLFPDDIYACDTFDFAVVASTFWENNAEIQGSDNVSVVDDFKRLTL